MVYSRVIRIHHRMSSRAEGGIVEEAGLVVFAHREPGEDKAGKDDADYRDEQGGERVEIVE